MPLEAADSQKSAARFVRRSSVVPHSNHGVRHKLILTLFHAIECYLSIIIEQNSAFISPYCESPS